MKDSTHIRVAYSSVKKENKITTTFEKVINFANQKNSVVSCASDLEQLWINNGNKMITVYVPECQVSFYVGNDRVDCPLSEEESQKLLEILTEEEKRQIKLAKEKLLAQF